MGTAPRFSVIMPVYNVGAYLDESVGSVLAQTYGDYEVILVDDGSTDGSGEKCDVYAAGHPNFRVIHQENRGLLLARRIGLRNASGDYVVTLDSDDELHPDALALISGAIDRWSPDIVAFDYSRSVAYIPYGPASLDIKGGFYEKEQYNEFKKIVCRGRHNSLWSKVFRRTIVDADADYLPYQGMTHAEDLFQLLPMVDCARSFVYLPRPLYFYRINTGSVTKRYRPRQLDDLCIALSRLLNYADKWGSGNLDLAHGSALMQCSYLLHILMWSPMDEATRKLEFVRLCNCAQRLGLFGPWEHSLRIDKRLDALALRKGIYGLARAAAAMLWLAQKARDRRASCR